MFVLTGRLAAAAAAAIVATVAWFVAAPGGGDAPTLGKALDALAATKSYHLKMDLGGQPSEAWVRAPGELRWNRGDGAYQIARGDRLWDIDEKANRAASRQANYFRGGGLHPLGMLLAANLLGGVEDKSYQAVLQAAPAERAVRDGVEVAVYSVRVPAADEELLVEAEYDLRRSCLRKLVAKRGRAGKFTSLAAIEVAAVGQPVPEELFVVGDTLTEDGRIGKLVDAQGAGGLRPLNATRWTPASEGLLVMPGDWLRTDLRGANALAVRLVKDTRLTLGPGALVETPRPNLVRVWSGDVKVLAAENAPVEVVGPDKRSATVRGSQLFRIQDENLVRLDKEPLWLKGFEGRAVGESIGSLVANIDGRNTPLTVGYHKVAVDIRDQIARTIVEESFVNRTDGRLEGVFYFPLPQDASISGFGMWIGDELVEADVVEKQRAREIYETILRERRDPGLLEWSGGNLFKARVFPIEPHSEKRIKITYTQVLPLVCGSFRYSYALQSEMLRQYPLRELAITVHVNSAMPLKSATSPTHPVRAQQTAHSARLEFAAQEYTPTRDFEVVAEVDGQQQPVVLIPHRRGDDGYFMALLTPPGVEGAAPRSVLPEGEPLDLLILADTSASLDRAARGVQGEFIAALFGSLTPKDRINLACCDVECDWAFPRPVPAEPKNLAAAGELLARRVSLGWTDLDKAFAAAFDQAGPRTRIIYVGDAIPTAGDADAVAFAQRLRQAFEAKAFKGGKAAACYAVSVGSLFESGVLKAIAACGGGTVRQIGGERGPQTAARELLVELARPTLRNVRVEFRGLRTARVYPEQLPNLPAGQQQIILGRYLPSSPSPTAADQSGEIVVSGIYEGRPVQFTSRVSLKDAEQGNSFIPRLWARMHLDSLLAQGSSQAIQDEIVALSEEYHIMTPYTSLLVLESDADRERFKVKRRFLMRDGEKFFAAGRDNVDYDLVQQQMRRAGLWRLGMRRSVLGQLASLGRNPAVFGQIAAHRPFGDRGMMKCGSGAYSSSGVTNYRSVSGGLTLGGDWESSGAEWYYCDAPVAASRPMGGFDRMDALQSWDANGETHLEMLKAEQSESDRKSNEDFSFGAESERLSRNEAAKDLEDMPAEMPALTAPMTSATPAAEPMDYKSGEKLPKRLEDGLEIADPFSREDRRRERSLRGNLGQSFGGYLFAGDGWSAGEYRGGGGRSYAYAESHGQWLDALFPALPGVPGTPTLPTPKKPWPAEAKAVAEGLVRVGALKGLAGGLRIERQGDAFDPRFNVQTSQGTSLALYGPKAWLTRHEGRGSQTIVNWCDGQQRGVLGLAFQLGRTRAADPAELAPTVPGLGLEGHQLTSLEQSYRDYDVQIERQGDDRALLRISLPKQPHETLIAVDTARRVVLSQEQRHEGKTTGTTRYDGFVETAGAWWPTRSESFDGQGRRTSRTTWKLTALSADELAAQVAAQLAARDQAQLLKLPLPTLVDAKRAAAAGKAAFEDHCVLMQHFSRSQQWTRVTEHLDRAAELAAGKPGVRWVRDAVLNLSRRRDELRTRIMDEAAALAKAAGPAPTEELFLAEHLTNQAGGILEANEMLQLLDALRPVCQRQPVFTLATKTWRQRRVNYLHQTSQAQAALRLQAELADEFRHDYSLQQQYAQALGNVGEHETAYRRLRDLLGGKTEWLPHEADALRNTLIGMLQNQGRWQESLELLAEWMKRKPEGQSVYEQYLGALVRLGRNDEADRLAAEWLKAGMAAEKPAADALGRLHAAVALMLGRCSHVYMQRLDEQWLRPLGDAAIHFARHEQLGNLADTIMGEWRFSQTDKCRRVRRAALAMLQQEMDKLGRGELQRLINWLMANDPAVEQQTWRQLAGRLRKRWAAEKDHALRRELAGPLDSIYANRLTPEERLGFIRAKLQSAEPAYRAQHRNELFHALLAMPWSAEYEAEALGLLDQLTDQAEAAARLAAHLGALHAFSDRMVQARNQHALKNLEHPEKLTRTELRAKQVEALKQAREHVADVLRKEAARREGRLAAWTTAERLYLEVALGRNLAKVADECWEILGPPPKGSDLPSPSGKGAGGEGGAQSLTDADTAYLALLDDALRSRMFAMLANLSARKEAAPELAARLLKYVDARQAAAEPDDLRWQNVKYQLLVALDRPQDLEQELRRWVAADGPINRWRLVLGYLLAEQGKLAEAIPLFEAVAAADELGPAEYRALADWYMAVNRRADHQRAMIAVYKTLEPWRLSNLLDARLRPWQRPEGHLPSELDKEVLLVFAALFEKAPNPENYLWQLQQFYRETRDFRLLACLADGMLGHTAGRAYPFLQGMSGVLGEVRDEATADAIVEQLAKVRQRAKTPVDQRALDLLEALVERRAAEVLNQPGPHADKALAALQRAMQRPRASGEPRLLADLLASLGRIAHPKLAAEQVRQLEILLRDAPQGTMDRLHIAHRLASTYWAYDRHDPAIDLLTLELREFERAQGGRLPPEANDPLATLIGYFESRGHHARGEQLLLDQLQRPVNSQQQRWLTERLYELYERAVGADAQVSLGKGAVLYRAAAAKVEADLATGDPNHRSNLLARLCSLYRTAHQKKIAGVADDVRVFAFLRFSAIVRRDLNNYASLVNSVAHTVHDLVGPRDGLAVLIEQMEQEPRWLRFANQDGWAQYGGTLAYWRSQAPNLGDLAPRLLKLTLDELRQDLLTRQSRSRSMYHHSYSYYWAEKADDFARVAEEVYQQRKDSGAAVAYIAEYVYNGLRRFDRGIEMLLIAYRQERLEEPALAQLITYLHEQERHGESVAILLPLIERRPDNMQYRVWLLRAYCVTRQPAQLAAALKQIDEYFRQKDRWTEGNIAALAHSCLENGLFAESVKYYQEVIPLHQRTQPNRGIGNGTLSQYYVYLAQAFAGLKKTAEAVEAACGAIVSWGPRHDRRAEALSTLQHVLRQATNLDAYVAALDKSSAETGLHNPIVRKALGQLYLERKEYAKAAVQLKLAVELQPNDTETHQALIACCDQQGDKAGAVAQLLQSLQLSRRDIKLYGDLGRRYEELTQPRDAERAYTAIVEMLAAESEGHAALAEIRQRQNRWPEAIECWRHAARLRALEPTGLQRLAEAQIHEKRWDDADATVRQLEGRTWPTRFNDAEQKTRQLRQQIEQGRGKRS